MKRKIALLVLLVTTLSLGLVLASFRQPQADADAETASYEASSFDLPREAEYITDLKAMQDGTICAVAGSSQAQDVICYTSKDQGKTWEETARYGSRLPITIKQTDYVEGYGYLAEDGTIGIYLGIIPNTSKSDVEKDSSNLKTKNYNFIIQPNGTIISIEHKTVQERSCYKMHFAGNSCYLEDIQGNLYEVNKTSGTWKGKVLSYDKVDLLNGKLFAGENGIYAVDAKQLTTITSERTETSVELVLERLQKHINPDAFEREYVTAASENLNILYYGDKQGLWKITDRGEICLISGKDIRNMTGKGDFRNLVVLPNGTMILAVSTIDGQSSLVQYAPVQ